MHFWRILKTFLFLQKMCTHDTKMCTSGTINVWVRAGNWPIAFNLKGLGHRFLGWKCLSKNQFRHYSQYRNVKLNVWLLKIRWKVHENWGKSLFCPMDKKMISPYRLLLLHVYWMVYWKVSWFINNFLQNYSTWYLKFMLHHAVI